MNLKILNSSFYYPNTD